MNTSLVIANTGPINSANVIPAAAVDNDVTNDYIFARNQIYELLGHSNRALANLAILAEQSQNFSVYRVLSELLKSTSDINDRLLELQKARKDVTGTTDKRIEVNNAVIFHGTSADLLSMIRNKPKVLP